MCSINLVKTNFFTIALITCAIGGIVLPITGSAGITNLDKLTKIAVILLFFLYGARISPVQTIGGIKQWQLHCLTLTLTYLMFPLFGMLFYNIIRILIPNLISPTLAEGIIFLTLIPSTMQSSILFTSIAKGNIPAAIISASMSNLLGVFLTPLLVLIFFHTANFINISINSVLSIFIEIFLPFILGQLSRKFLLNFIAQHVLITRIIDRGSTLLVVYTAFCHGSDKQIWNTIPIYLLILIAGLCFLLLIIILSTAWYFSGKLNFKFNDRIVVLFCGSKKSLAAGLPIALVLFSPNISSIIILPLILFHIIQSITGAQLAQYISKLH